MLGVAEWMISWKGKKWELKHFLLKSIKQCKAASEVKKKKKICVFYTQMSNCSFSHTVKQCKKWSADHPRESEQHAIQSGMPYKQKKLANTKKLQISGMFPGQITISSNANIYAIFGSENNIAWPTLWCLAFRVLEHFSKDSYFPIPLAGPIPILSICFPR